MKLCLRATGCHLPYGITVVLPATQHKWAHLALTSAKKTATSQKQLNDWHSIYLLRTPEGWKLSWPKSLVTYWDGLLVPSAFSVAVFQPRLKTHLLTFPTLPPVTIQCQRSDA